MGVTTPPTLHTHTRVSAFAILCRKATDKYVRKYVNALVAWGPGSSNFKLPQILSVVCRGQSASIRTSSGLETRGIEQPVAAIRPESLFALHRSAVSMLIYSWI